MFGANAKSNKNDLTTLKSVASPRQNFAFGAKGAGRFAPGPKDAESALINGTAKMFDILRWRHIKSQFLSQYDDMAGSSLTQSVELGYSLLHYENVITLSTAFETF